MLSSMPALLPLVGKLANSGGSNQNLQAQQAASAAQLKTSTVSFSQASQGNSSIQPNSQQPEKSSQQVQSFPGQKCDCSCQCRFSLTFGGCTWILFYFYFF